jgi:hypothetical protein
MFGARVAWLSEMSPIQYDPLFLPLAAIPSPTVPASGKVDLTDLADPTKTQNQSGSFAGFLSAINPLQHIPVVGTIYRAITGDVPAPAARVLGGTLLGGPIGLIVSAASAIFEQDTGHEPGGQVLALFGSDRSNPAGPASQMAGNADEAVLNDAPIKSASVTAPEAGSVAEPWAPATAGTSDPIIPAAQDLSSPSPAAPPPAALRSGAPRANPGRSMADYWAGAGSKMPVVDNTRTTGSPQQAPIRLQFTPPGAADIRHTPVVSAVATTAATAANPATTNDKQPSDWVAAAMMHGLDRYREMKRREEQPQGGPQIDTEL